MKSFRNILSEVAEPKAGDEKHFKDKHITVKNKHPVAGDNAFTGGTKKAPKRIADHDVGEDAEVYEGLDPVNKKAAMGKFKDRADKDIDNDGDVDSSDKYLHARRKAITKAVHKEEAEELDEISRDTARSYIRKAMAHKTTGETPKKDRSASVSLAGKKAYGIGGKAKVSATESVEQLDELSPNTLHSYIKKAAGNMAGNAAVAAAQASSSMKKSSPDVKRNIRNRMRGITGASGRLADKANMAENAWEEVPMMMRQLAYVAYAAEDVMEYLEMDVDPEEWFQNKLAHIHGQMQTLHAYVEGEKRMMSRMDYGMYGEYSEEVELDEAAPAYSATYIKNLKNTFGDKKSLSRMDMAKAKKIIDQSSNENIRQLAAAGIPHISDMAKAHLKNNLPGGMKKEEVEELDELSKKTLGSYVKKATGDAVTKAYKAGDVRDKDSGKNYMKALGRQIGISKATSKLAKEEAELDEAAPKIKPDFLKTQREKDRAHDAAMGRTPTGRKKPMTSTQRSLASMRKEESELDEVAPTKKAITRALQGLRAQPKEKVSVKKAPWEKNEEVELDESITKMPHGRLKFHLNTSTPHGSYSNDEMKSERDRRLKSGEGEAYRKAKAGLNEVTQTAMKKSVTYIDPKGHSRTRDVPVKRIEKDERGQDKIRESVEMLDEAFKAGMVKLKDGGSVILKKEDADLLNKMFKGLSSTNRKKMEDTMMTDKAGFEEIVGFAREAM
jgi:hypothetical protein